MLRQPWTYGGCAMIEPLARASGARAQWLSFYQQHYPDVQWHANGRLSRTLGRYFIGQRRIEISKRHLLADPSEQVYQTLCHEYAHHLATLEGVRGHAPRWRAIMSALSGIPYQQVRATAAQADVAAAHRWYLVWCKPGGIERQATAWFRRPSRDARQLMLKHAPQSLGQLRYVAANTWQAWQAGELDNIAQHLEH